MEVRNVAVIGNGPSLLEHSYGAQIDACDVVIRMNRIRLSPKLQPHIGSRLDVYVTYFAPGNGLIPLLESLNVTAIWWAVIGNVRAVLDTRTASWQEWSLKTGREFQEIPSDIVNRAYQEMGITDSEKAKDKKPTTGIVTLLYACERWPNANIYAAGFDGYAPNKSAYYWRDAPIEDWELRKVLPHKNRAWFDMMIRSGRVQRFQ